MLAHDEYLDHVKPAYSDWRSEARNHPERANLCNAKLVKANLSHAPLLLAQLNGADLRGANLSGAWLFNANLSFAHMTDAQLIDAHLNGAVLCSADLRRADLRRADLRDDADLRGANLSGAHLIDAKMIGAHLQGADLSRAQLNRATLTGAYLQGADLSRADLTNANLGRANLIAANLNHAILYEADLSHAFLYLANLNSAQLIDAKLIDAGLLAADLSSADLVRAKLNGADLTEVKVGKAVLAQADLTHAIYSPVSEPPDSYVTDIQGLSTLHVPSNRQTGLVQVRKLLEDAGLRDEERDATYAIQRSRTTQLLASASMPVKKLLAQSSFIDGVQLGLVPAGDDSAVSKFAARDAGSQGTRSFAWIEGLFRMVGFDVTTAYGMQPTRGLLLIVILAGGFTLVYIWPILLVPKDRGKASRIDQAAPTDRVDEPSDNVDIEKARKVSRSQDRWHAFWADSGIYQVLPADRIDEPSAEPTVEKETKWKRVGAADCRNVLLKLADVFRKAAYFSLLSAVNIGFEQFTPGDWIRRLQGRDYSLQAVGWVRFVAGIQSLLSVYLLAMWVLTQFYRPFE